MIDFFSSFLLYRVLWTRVNCKRWREWKQFLPFSCLDCTGDLFQLYCGNILSVVILFADKLKTSTDKLSSYYINVKYFKKSAFWYDNLKPFPKKVVTKRVHRPTFSRTVFFRPQTATNRLCGLCWARSGTCPIFLFARHGAKKGASDYLAAHHFILNSNKK